MLVKPDDMTWEEWEAFLHNLGRRRSRHRRGVAGAQAGAYGAGTAPTGFRWEYVTLNGERVTLNSTPVVALVGN